MQMTGRKIFKQKEKKLEKKQVNKQENSPTCDEDHKYSTIYLALRHHPRQRRHLIRAKSGVIIK